MYVFWIQHLLRLNEIRRKSDLLATCSLPLNMQKNIYKILRKQKMKVIFDVIFALLQHSQITHDKKIRFDNYLYCSYNGCGPYIVIYIHYSRSFSLSRQIMHSIYESFYSSDSLPLFSCLHMEECENDVDWFRTNHPYHILFFPRWYFRSIIWWRI